MLGLHAKCVEITQQRKSRKFGQLRALVVQVRSGHNGFKIPGDLKFAFPTGRFFNPTKWLYSWPHLATNSCSLQDR